MNKDSLRNTYIAMLAHFMFKHSFIVSNVQLVKRLLL